MTDESESPIDEAGGETSCYAHLVCPDCGIVVDASAHRAWCTLAPTPESEHDAITPTRP